ncbi:MAG: trypsin-like peptidase domain-containing protein [Planctomycetota bacterium]
MPKLRQALLQSTVRIQYEHESSGRTYTGHGTAFGVDLSQYGYPASHRYLLTAAHNVLDDNKVPYPKLRVELRKGDSPYWSKCRVLAWDEYIDLCIVESGGDLPHLLTLAGSDPKLGSRLVLAGSPRGVPVELHTGTLDRKFERGTVRSSASVLFDHGDSGGPMVDAVSGLVVGVAVAGVPKDGDMDHNVGLFVPVVGVASFMEANSQKIFAPAPAAPQFIEPAPKPNQHSGTKAATPVVALKTGALGIGTASPKTSAGSE